ncbi:hypothetical protein [Chitinophaga varians]
MTVISSAEVTPLGRLMAKLPLVPGSAALP